MLFLTVLISALAALLAYECSKVTATTAKPAATKKLPSISHRNLGRFGLLGVLNFLDDEGLERFVRADIKIKDHPRIKIRLQEIASVRIKHPGFANEIICNSKRALVGGNPDLEPNPDYGNALINEIRASLDYRNLIREIILEHNFSDETPFETMRLAFKPILLPPKLDRNFLLDREFSSKVIAAFLIESYHLKGRLWLVDTLFSVEIPLNVTDETRFAIQARNLYAFMLLIDEDQKSATRFCR